jgi:hypothetical protein
MLILAYFPEKVKLFIPLTRVQLEGLARVLAQAWVPAQILLGEARPPKKTLYFKENVQEGKV